MPEDVDELTDFLSAADFELPDFDLQSFDDLLDDEHLFENRYIKPNLGALRSHRVIFDNAVELAKNIKLDHGLRYDCVISGNFIFGDFIEALLTEHNIRADCMTIATLSMSQENVDSLANLLHGGYVGNLNLILSAYFFANERHALIPYIYEHLDTAENTFQLSVVRSHCKIAQFITAGGRKIVMHGSANLRSSANIEQFTIEENPELYDFYEQSIFSVIIENYSTINKKVHYAKLWEQLSRKKFND